VAIDLDAFEERAAIMEYDGGLSRFQAETKAAELIGKKRWEIMDAIRKRDTQAARDQRQAHERESAGGMP